MKYRLEYDSEKGVGSIKVYHPSDKAYIDDWKTLYLNYPLDEVCKLLRRTINGR